MAPEGPSALLLEIGCEELPPLAIDSLREALFDAVADGLEKAGLAFDRANSRSFSTPRRLALRMHEVPARQPDQLLERRGPAVSAAFDDDGNPTAAALGFATSVGLDVDELTTLESGKGAWLYCEQKVEGKAIGDVIFHIIESALKQLPIPRPMRWSDNEFTFVRPVHWVLLLHGDKVIDGEILGRKTGRTTQGHRIHSPGTHVVASTDQYEQVLLDARVIADPEVRRDRIVGALRAADQDVIIEDDLLGEVNNLVEWPVAVRCRFDEDFLQIPHEALVASMQDHQKFFPIRGGTGGANGAAIRNAFIAVSNIESEDPAVVQKGFERVIRPRLADARFFFEQDKEVPLQDYAEALNGVIFQKKIGTVADKSRRIGEISAKISEFMGRDPVHVTRAAELCKCDLMTQMVGEFPELQGIMGGHYALASGEPEPVATAIGAHYAPRFSGDAIPSTLDGQILAISDKADTVVGIFSAGLKPSGNKDPYALRRAALGLVRILSEAELAVPLGRILDWACEALKDYTSCDAETLDEVEAFVLQRARAHYRDQGLAPELISAAFASSWMHWPDLDARITALRSFVGREEAQSLAAANKRIGNILRKAEVTEIGPVQEKLLQLDEERALFDEISRTSEEVRPMLEASNYTDALARLAALRDPVDRFFDAVLVMDEDPEVRNNRLALLHRLKAVFDVIADLSVLA